MDSNKLLLVATVEVEVFRIQAAVMEMMRADRGLNGSVTDTDRQKQHGEQVGKGSPAIERIDSPLPPCYRCL